MDHKSFLIQLQSRLGKDKGEIDSYMSAFLQILKERCSQMDTVAIQGFGLFEPKKKLERVVVNPSTGKRMLVPPFSRFGWIAFFKDEYHEERS